MTAPHDDIQELLAAYALDALEPEEIARLHALLEERPELRATLAELRATANKLPYGLPEATPPAELRQRVLDYATGRAAPAAVAPKRGRGWLLALGGLAAAAIVAAAIGWGQVIGLRGELARTNDKLTQAYADLSKAQVVLATLQGGSGEGSVVRTREGATVFAVNLPQLQAGRTYQLWRIPKGSPPASAGVFSVDPRGFGVFALEGSQQPQSGETVAVTDEPGPLGSEGPTMQPLILGEVKT